MRNSIELYGSFKCAKFETRDLFELVRQKIFEERKPQRRTREYAFVRMMVCGLCGSGVTALEKEKVIKSEGGVTRKYVYYACGRSKDKRCKNLYIREDHLMEQLAGIIDQIEVDRIGAKHLIEKEVARYNKINAKLLGTHEKVKASDMDIKRYAKYLLEERSTEEKREIFDHLRGNLIMRDKKISLIVD